LLSCASSPGDTDTGPGQQEVRYLGYGDREGTSEQGDNYIQTNGGYQSFGDWKAARCFTGTEDDLEYFNSVDLALGRKLTFTKCGGRSAACVENLGTPGQSAIDGLHALNGQSSVAVCMDHSPSRPAGFEIQFFVFIDQFSANGLGFDRQGTKLSPFACTACHGGRFVAADAQSQPVNMVEGAQFLPLLAESLFFNDIVAAPEQETIRQMNEIVYDTATAPGIHDLLDASYPGKLPGDGVHTLGTSYTPDGTPASWVGEEAYYHGLIRKHCLTCHAAQPQMDFGSRAEVPDALVRQLVCDTGDMPNSLVGRNRINDDGDALRSAGCED